MITSGTSKTSCSHLTQTLIQLRGPLNGGVYSLGKLERNCMSHMHAITARSAPRVQKKRLALLMPIQDQIELSMAKDDASTHESMGPMARYSLEPVEKILVDEICAKVPHKLVVVHRQKLARLIHSTRNIKRRDDLLDSLGRRGFLCQAQVGERWWLSWFVCHDEGLADSGREIKSEPALLYVQFLPGKYGKIPHQQT